MTVYITYYNEIGSFLQGVSGCKFLERITCLHLRINCTSKNLYLKEILPSHASRTKNLYI